MRRRSQASASQGAAMSSVFLAYAIGTALMVMIYFVIRRIGKSKKPVNYHLVERILIFSIALILVLAAIVIT
jgi:uncharacterized membrane-anchored protein